MSETTAATGRLHEAGRRGKDVRSDLCVSYGVDGGGPDGPDVVVRSRVEPYYGNAIRRQVREVFAAFGVSGGRVELDDAGAVPFVIEARIEAALRSAFPERFGETASGPSGDAASGASGASAMAETLLRLVPRWDAAKTAPRSARVRLRRSRLYVPGSEPKYMLNAGLHRADGIILDLEDSVHPAEKDAARLLVRNALLALGLGAAERMVRINQLPLGLADLAAIVPALPDLILIPKVEHAAQVRDVDETITRILSGLGLTESIWLMPILESALGIENAFEIATASPRVAALTIGLEDYTADLGVVKTPIGEESLFARNRVVNAAKAAGIQAIDSVYGDIEDLAGLEAWALRSRGMGFEGMGCVHPRQIPVIHRGFAPTQVEIEKSLRIVAAFEDAKARGLGVVSLGSKMIDAPVVNRAVRLVAQARAMGLIDPAEAAAGANGSARGEGTR
ncbi:MAG: aldolase/citrate lyase family protein [Candidatus Eisenbacteria bacterium]